MGVTSFELILILAYYCIQIVRCTTVGGCMCPWILPGRTLRRTWRHHWIQRRRLLANVNCGFLRRPPHCQTSRHFAWTAQHRRCDCLTQWISFEIGGHFFLWPGPWVVSCRCETSCVNQGPAEAAQKGPFIGVGQPGGGSRKRVRPKIILLSLPTQ